jgi:hypothetical protein
MSLKLNLGTMAGIRVAGDLEQRVAQPIVVRSGSLSINLKMPQPGRNVVRVLDILKLEEAGKKVNLSITGGISQFTFDAEMVMPTGPVKFGYKNIGINDTVSIMQVEVDRFLVSAFHAQKTIGCRAVCPDGSEGQPCVDCLIGGITFRICC